MPRLHLTLAATSAFFAWLVFVDVADAGDHQEAPELAADPAADIGDLYAWHDDGRLIVAMTYAGYTSTLVGARYDARVAYTFYIDTDDDARAEHEIEVRFGHNALEEWGFRVTGIPGEGKPISGAVEGILEGATGARAWAGLRDDPFFFDFEGLQVTLATGVLSFDSTRDFAAYQNTNAIVVELPLDELAAEGPIRVWATTARES
jgi:hypothetical protein